MVRRIEKSDMSDWMSGVSGNVLVNNLCLYGTRSSVASYSDLNQNFKAQIISIEEQLNLGVRLFDVTVTFQGDTLMCCYGFALVMDFYKFQEILADFLKEHKTETVFLKVNKLPTTKFVSKFDIKTKYMHPYAMFSCTTSRLSEFRGKIAVIHFLDTWPFSYAQGKISMTLNYREIIYEANDVLSIRGSHSVDPLILMNFCLHSTEEKLVKVGVTDMKWKTYLKLTNKYIKEVSSPRKGLWYLLDRIETYEDETLLKLINSNSITQ
jgi:hypothetical protein